MPRSNHATGPDQQESSDVVAELRHLKRIYGSYQKMVDELQEISPGFEGLHRGTIRRWITKGPTPRAALAVRVLRSRHRLAQLPIAVPETDWLVPLGLLCWDFDESGGVSLAKERYGFEFVPTRVQSGGEAFSLLSKDHAHMAIGARRLTAQLPKECPVLCSVVTGEIVGVSIKPVRTIADLEGQILGYPKGSVIDQEVTDLSRARGVEPPRLADVQAQDSTNVARLLRNKNLTAMVGWEPYISMIQEQSSNLYRIPKHLLGALDLVVAINTRIADPGVARAYLRLLSDAINTLAPTKLPNTLRKRITERLGQRRAEAALEFSVHRLRIEADTVLGLWYSEVAHMS